MISLMNLMFTNQAYAQNLCSSPEAELNGFKFLTPSEGCGPMTVEIEATKPEYSDVKYIYTYNGEGADQLSALAPTESTTYNYFKEKVSTEYTILQYGKNANGNTFYSCKNVTIKASEEPFFTSSACNNSQLQIIIPDSSINNFDYFEVDWDDGSNSHQTFKDFSLPLVLSKNYPPKDQRNISITGKYIIPNNSCDVTVKKTISMKAGENYPNIDTLEIIDDNMISLSFSGAADQIYSVYRRNSGTTYDFNNFSYQLKPGKHLLNVRLDSQYCFTLFRSFGCMETSGEVCTTNLDSIEYSVEGNSLNWTAHPKTSSVYFGPGLPDSKTTDASQELLIDKNTIETRSLKLVESNYLDPYINCSDSDSICYQIISNIKGFSRGSDSIPFSSISKSQKRCMSFSSLKPSLISSVLATVADAKTIVYFSPSNWSWEAKMFYLNDTSLLALDSTETLLPFATDYDSLESYSVSYIDVCNRISENSPRIKTTFLYLKDNKTLSWKVNNPFYPDTVRYLELISLEPNDDSENLIQTFDNIEHNSFPIEKIGDFDSRNRFFLKVYSSDKRMSQSNTISIPAKLKLFIPDVFTPNYDGINDEFKVFGNFENLKFFEIKIINRNGKTVFEAQNPKEYWDGKINNEPVPSGIYFFIINLEDFKGIKDQFVGSLLLIN